MSESKVGFKGNSWVTGLFVHSDVDDSDLTLIEMRVYMRLCRRANDELRVWEGQKKMADGCGMSRVSVHKALHGLRDKGWIILEERYRGDGSQTTSNIVICGPPPPPDGTPPSAKRNPPFRQTDSLSISLEVDPLLSNKRLTDSKITSTDPSLQSLLFPIPEDAGQKRLAEEGERGDSEQEGLAEEERTGDSEQKGGSVGEPEYSSSEFVCTGNAPPKTDVTISPPPAKQMTPEAERKQFFAIKDSQKLSVGKALKEKLGEKYIHAQALIKKHGVKEETILRQLQSKPAALTAFLRLNEDTFDLGISIATEQAAKHTDGFESNIGYQFFLWLTKPAPSPLPVETPGKPAPYVIDYLSPDWKEKFQAHQDAYNSWVDEDKRRKDEQDT